MSTYLYQSTQIDYSVWPSTNYVRAWWLKLRGKPTTILFLHGINDPYQNYTNILQQLAQYGFDVYALNFPGHGDSDLDPKISWELLTDIVNQFASTHNVRNVILMGYSMGGGISLKLLEEKPAWLAKVILLAPFCTPFSSKDLLHTKDYLKEFVLKHIQEHHPHKPPPRCDHRVYVLEHYGHIFLDYNLDTARLNNHSVPVTVLLNSEDRVILPTTVKSVLQGILNIEFVEMPSISHDLYYITPEQADNYVQTIIKHGT